jgi:1-acyl-sn-glycerol-3-phosphate acyltransferase
LKPFKLGAFRLALEESVDILPIAIHGTRNMVQKNRLIPSPARLEIVVLPRVSTREHESAEELSKRVHGILAKHLADAKTIHQTSKLPIPIVDSP